ncbi:xanthine dehydrogenase family protein subunit M [Luteolibacter yonseiensis]|uniref:Xanthine dehydrogenase family protein subunit M n=1 Tax=Luteolibacter yonseiensis TaxID=1144680 RepID=A0A934R691_9BACT|nr:xanthine dehydrogenase family protein subunit M [Luteolibacter yonseiensis]MBK1817006.1 xanthine dehydrogenase family protein subunit M [Luteolibacter yonseiensis]
MKLFEYHRAVSAEDAVRLVNDRPEVRFLAGGTNLLDLMKDGIRDASDLVDLTRAGMTEIGKSKDGLSIGALVTNADTANHPLVRSGYPLLSRAILAGATMQIRNMATNGGNILQRTRCPYYYDMAMPCNKRKPGSGCGALEGLNRTHAIFGAGDSCVAVHPSDMAVALAALDATVTVLASDGQARSIPFAEFHRLPGENPEQDNNLRKGELIVSIELPPPVFTKHVYYLKVRDRTSYAFALVSVAVAMELDGDVIKAARVAMGGVAHKPWLATRAQDVLRGNPVTPELFEKAAAAEMEGARPLAHNAYKVELGRRAIVRALREAAAVA